MPQGRLPKIGAMQPGMEHAKLATSQDVGPTEKAQLAQVGWGRRPPLSGARAMRTDLLDTYRGEYEGESLTSRWTRARSVRRHDCAERRQAAREELRTILEETADQSGHRRIHKLARRTIAELSDDAATTSLLVRAVEAEHMPPPTAVHALSNEEWLRTPGATGRLDPVLAGGTKMWDLSPIERAAWRAGYRQAELDYEIPAGGRL